MSSRIGQCFTVSLFGESHGSGIGCVIEGIPAGTVLDLDQIRKRLNQRRPGKDQYSTPRQEADSFDILSGYFMDQTTGTPLCAVFRNSDTRSKDYQSLKTHFRPGHADFTGGEKYRGANDFRGGGHFSARVTAALVFAGAIAEQLIEVQGIKIATQVQGVGSLRAESFETLELTEAVLNQLDGDGYAIQESVEADFLKAVDDARMALDSIGGIVEGVILNVPVGLGEPFYDAFESRLAHGLFAIPAVKGVSFGKGFDFVNMRGSEANDLFYADGDVVKTRTNNNAGINGGITNGMPVWFKCAFKPTPSIAKPQETLNRSTMQTETLEIKGRHDPCVALRAATVVRAMTAIITYDLWLESKRR
ncbi:MAG: chorismate synthase [Clostridiales bacterium]|jgi:chorismate synthase|nr:chorismate synthase [Clostridiales bacterium]MDN5299360.1 chorismate synthase [Clostridiales bacterium]